MPRVLLASGDAAFRETLRSTFESDPDFVVCGEAKDTVAMAAQVVDLVPNLIVLEADCQNDFQISKVIKAFLPGIQVFLMIEQNDMNTEKKAFSRGVDAVFDKNEDLPSLLMNARAAFGLK